MKEGFVKRVSILFAKDHLPASQKIRLAGLADTPQSLSKIGVAGLDLPHAERDRLLSDWAPRA